MGSVSGNTDSPVSFFPLLAEFPSGTWVLTKPANFACASKIRPGGASVPPLLRENGKTPVAYVGDDWYSM